jgi:Uma2 family endonuclease
MTIVEFDDVLERMGDEASLYELLDGAIVMMTNPTQKHGIIVGNIGARLKLAMVRQSCQSFQGDIRIQRSADKNAADKPKPDVVVRCGPGSPDRDLLTYVDDPVVVVKVASPSTMDIDRGRKLQFYKSLKTLKHVVIGYQDEMRIEHHKRSVNRWTMKALTKPEDVLDLSAVEFTMTVAEAYFDVSIA